MPDETKNEIRERLIELKTLTVGENIKEFFSPTSVGAYFLYKEAGEEDFSILEKVKDTRELMRMREARRAKRPGVPYKHMRKSIEEFMDGFEDHTEILSFLEYTIDKLIDDRRR